MPLSRPAVLTAALLAFAHPDPAVAQENPTALADESRAEAREGEARLDPDARFELQIALQWFGLYRGAIDGDFGPGTRNAMASWQETQGMDPTGVLTTRQRGALLGAYRDEVARYGFDQVNDDRAGVTVMLPLNLVEFDRHDPPFVHFRGKVPDAPRIVLISQPGDQAALRGLYDLLQTLRDVPLEGERSLSDTRFRITGQSDTTTTVIQAELRDGAIKGWMVISSAVQSDRDARILELIERTFSASGPAVLDPGAVVMSDEARTGLVAGLERRTPRLSRSGFFISPEGAVLTTVEAVEGCGRITIDRQVEAEVRLADAATGLAVLTPLVTLAPRSHAAFAPAPHRPGIEVTLAGYSYEDRLPAPVLTFGTLVELTGLAGEADLRRLALAALPGDVGGPVLDATGALVGMLLPAAGASDGKQLPPGVVFALGADRIAAVIQSARLTPAVAEGTGALLPIELTDRATGMTTLVSCWD